MSVGTAPADQLIDQATPSRYTPRVPDETGLGGIEVLPIGLLVITMVTLVVIGAWNVIDAKMAVTGAAREGARNAVETFDAGKARAAALAAWQGHGRHSPVEVDIAGALTRCGQVTVTAAAIVTPIRVPLLRDWAKITVRSVHAELVDPYRSGMGGEAQCNS